MNQPRKFRVGLLGAGYISEYHMRALRRLDCVEIAGIVDKDQARAKDAAAKYGISNHSSLESMASKGLDVVHVLTPPPSHAALTLEALAAGCDVLVEKPFTTTVADCDRIETEAQKAGRTVCANHSLLYDF